MVTRPYIYDTRVTAGYGDLTNLPENGTLGELTAQVQANRHESDELIRTSYEAWISVAVGSTSPPPEVWLNDTAFDFGCGWWPDTSVLIPDQDNAQQEMLLSRLGWLTVTPSITAPTLEYFARWSTRELMVNHTRRKSDVVPGQFPMVTAGYYLFDPHFVFSTLTTYSVTVAGEFRLQAKWASILPP